MTIDLHVHSSYSDGVYTPGELVTRAAARGIDTLALADHDSVAGVGEAHVAGVASGVEIIAAVELSVEYEQWHDVHLLGYGIDCTDTVFIRKLVGFKERRDGRNDEILLRVNELLVEQGKEPLERERVRSFARDAIGRPHIARALLEKGYAFSVEDAFKRYLVPCNIPKCYWPIESAINEIHRLGGIAVLAHPTSITKDMEVLAQVLLSLQNIGLDGMEVFNNMGWPQEIEQLRRLALERGLLLTAGSDFHGIEDGLEMGRGREGMHFDNALLAPLYERIHCM